MDKPIVETEIFDQPSVVRRLLSEEMGHIQTVVSDLRGRFDFIFIAARGTSDNAARYAKYLFGAHNQIPVALAAPSLFTLYQKPPKLSRALVMAISQSGRSPDILAVMKEARKQGRPTVAVTNDSESPLAQLADYIFPLRAGKERAVAATKTYTSSLAVLAMFSGLLANNELAIAAMQNLPQAMQRTLTINKHIAEVAERFVEMQHCAVLSRGYNYATAFEFALKLKEMTRTVAEPYSSADILHGPVACLKGAAPVFAIMPSGAAFGDIHQLVSRLRSSGAELLLITDRQSLKGDYSSVLHFASDMPEWLTPIVAVIPGQLLCLALAQARGIDPDQLEGLQKVTETW